MIIHMKLKQRFQKKLFSKLFSFSSFTKHRFILLSLIILTLVSTLTAGIFYVKRSVSHWKEYRSDVYSFTFYYPYYWIYGEDRSLTNRNAINIYLRPEISNPADPTQGKINLWIYESEKTLDQFIDSELCSEPGGCTLSKTAERITLDGIDGMKITDKGGVFPSDVVVVKKDTTIIEFDFNYLGEDKVNYSNKTSKKIFDKILSTFRFINQDQRSKQSKTPSPIPKPNCSFDAKQIISKDGLWHNFESSVCGYTFSYPRDWNIDYTSNTCIVVGDLKNPSAVDPDNIKGHTMVQICSYSGTMQKEFAYNFSGHEGKNETIISYTVNGFSGVRGQRLDVIGIHDVVYLQGPSQTWVSIDSLSSDRATIDQILASFSFLDQIQDDPTVYWKTYSAKFREGFSAYSINYPENEVNITFYDASEIGEGMGEDYTEISNKNVKYDEHHKIKDGMVISIEFLGQEDPQTVLKEPIEQFNIGNIKGKKKVMITKLYTLVEYRIPLPNQSSNFIEYLNMRAMIAGPQSQAYIQLVDQMISTFTFINPDSLTP